MEDVMAGRDAKLDAASAEVISAVIAAMREMGVQLPFDPTFTPGTGEPSAGAEAVRQFEKVYTEGVREAAAA
jgi:hypothetical protein